MNDEEAQFLNEIQIFSQETFLFDPSNHDLEKIDKDEEEINSKIESLKSKLIEIRNARKNSDYKKLKIKKFAIISEINTLKAYSNQLMKENLSLKQFKEEQFDRHLTLIRNDILSSLSKNIQIMTKSNSFKFIERSTQTLENELKLERKKKLKLLRIDQKIDQLQLKENELELKLNELKQSVNFQCQDVMLVKRTEYEKLLYNIRANSSREKNCQPFTLDSSKVCAKTKECSCICGATFYYFGGLSQHKRICDIVKKIGIPCNVCKDVFVTQRAWKCHMLRRHPDHVEGSLLIEKNKKDKYTCLCGKGFKTCFYSYVKHRKVCEAIKEKAIFCPICKDPFASNVAMVNHLHHTHNKKKTPLTAIDGFRETGIKLLKKSRYHCLCGLYFHHSYENYTQHTRICSVFKEKAQYCDNCGNAFRTKLALNQHIGRVHSEKVPETNVTKAYKCACGQLFKSNYRLWSHGETCQEYQLKAITCPHCSRTYPSKHALGQHHRRAHKDLLYIVLQ